MAFGDFGKNAQRQIQRDYYNKTQQNANAPRRAANPQVNNKNKTQTDPEWN